MDAINKLVKGYAKFRNKYFEEGKHIYSGLVENGQFPEIAVVACSDSRVDPAIVFQCDPGDLFTIRNVANLVPPYEPSKGHHGTSAALEFAVENLEVKHVIVLGHSLCGGIQALIHNDHAECDSHFISQWMSIMSDVPRKVLASGPAHSTGDAAKDCEMAAIGLSLDHLMQFPFVQERVEAGALKLHGWYIDIISGELMNFDPESRKFITAKIA